jgi:hypothetical protein
MWLPAGFYSFKGFGLRGDVTRPLSVCECTPSGGPRFQSFRLTNVAAGHEQKNLLRRPGGCVLHPYQAISLPQTSFRRPDVRRDAPSTPSPSFEELKARTGVGTLERTSEPFAVSGRLREFPLSSTAEVSPGGKDYLSRKQTVCQAVFEKNLRIFAGRIDCVFVEPRAGSLKEVCACNKDC